MSQSLVLTIAVVVIAFLAVSALIFWRRFLRSKRKNGVITATVSVGRTGKYQVDVELMRPRPQDFVSLALLYISKVLYVQRDDEDWVSGSLLRFVDFLVGWRDGLAREPIPWDDNDLFLSGIREYLDASVSEIQEKEIPFTYVAPIDAHEFDEYSIQLVRGRTYNYILNWIPPRSSRLSLAFSAQFLYYYIAQHLDPQNLTLLREATKVYVKILNDPTELRNLYGAAARPSQAEGPLSVLLAIEVAKQSMDVA